MIRTYSKLIQFSTLFDRFQYLKLEGEVGAETFGYDRPLNQAFYSSGEWKSIRDFVIIRDNGCDLGIPEHQIHARPLVHHMNPIGRDDLLHGVNDDILNPEYLITVSHRTHNAIHFSAESQLPRGLVERRPGDTKLM